MSLAPNIEWHDSATPPLLLVSLHVLMFGRELDPH